MDMVSISQMTPGPFAVNCATFSGTRLHGLPGAVFATVGISLPSFILCLLVSRWFFEYNQSPVIRSILSGIKPIVLALIFSGLISLGGSTIFPGSAFQSIDIPVLIIALVSSFFMIRMKTSPILLIVISVFSERFS
jgi:chromate transporter